MSFDGNIVYHLVDEWKNSLINGRIRKIYQLSRFDLVFVIQNRNIRESLFISASPRYSRAYLSNQTFDILKYPPAFGMFLRKQLEGGVIKNIEQIKRDRIIKITINKRNELGDLSFKYLILEMMGRYSNVIVVDEYGVIKDAMKHNLNFEGTDRTIFPGAQYTYPPTTKFDPTDHPKLHAFLSDVNNINNTTLLQNIMGFSPQIIKEIMYQFEQGEPIYSIFNRILTQKKPVWIQGEKEDFYSLDLEHMKGNRIFYETVNELLDAFYKDRDRKDQSTQHAKDLKTFINNRISRSLVKIDKLSNQLQDTKKMDNYRVKGELIQANLHQLKKGMSTFETVNYYTNEIIQISLDPLKTPVQNSEQYFKKYKKLKQSIPHLKKQIDEAKKELEYFNELKSQLSFSNVQDIEEIRVELIDKKYVRGTYKKRQKSKPHFTKYISKDKIEIFVGKNNIQNEYLTHRFARYDDVWFHVQNAPGSHVIVHHPFPLSEDTIRLASNLAAYYSQYRESSSVAVDYTSVRYVKKIPGKVGSFVRYTNQKTIYIDPDETSFKNLKVKS
jgi:predicted ribosome quality control (RQC) complex YloA/Tae2 family protein